MNASAGAFCSTGKGAWIGYIGVALSTLSRIKLAASGRDKQTGRTQYRNQAAQRTQWTYQEGPL